MPEPKRILVVADNLALFRSENGCFDELPPGCEVHYSQSRSDALFCVRSNQYDIVFVELSDGVLSSADLLYEIRLWQPNTIRFLLGPSVDPDIIITCARGGHQFLQKPLDAMGLEAALERAELVHQILRDTDIQKLVANLRVFPSRPKIYLDLMRELRSPSASAKSIGALISEDLGISTKLLQVINSAYFGLKEKISSPSDAVFHLGMQTTASLVIALEVFAAFDHLHPNYFAIDHVWRHSQLVADAARRIAQVNGADSAIARDSYTAGLLHDIGKLALSINIKQEYGGVLRLARQREVPVWQAEMETFGTTHAAVGAYLLALWGMPATVVQAVAGHHSPAATLPWDFSALTAVHLANTMEYERLPLRHAFKGLQLDLDYPAELNLHEFLDPIKAQAGGWHAGPSLGASFGGGRVVLGRN